MNNVVTSDQETVCNYMKIIERLPFFILGQQQL
jgi:hypothetical protein